MSAVASNQQESVEDICRNVKDFDRYEVLEVDTAGPNIMVLKKDRKSDNYPAQERLIVNTKTRTYYHIKLAVSRIEWGGGKLREEVSLNVNGTEFYFSSVASKAAGKSSGDVQNLKLTPEVKEALSTCCKWCGVEDTQWGQCAIRLGINAEYVQLFDYVLRLEKQREEEKAEAALTPKVVAKPKVVEEKVEPPKEVMPAKCRHDTVQCPHTLKKRCFTCRTKIGMNALDCDCGKVFCATHQAPLHANEDLEHGHLCEFDHSGRAQEKLKNIYSRVLDE